MVQPFKLGVVEGIWRAALGAMSVAEEQGSEVEEVVEEVAEEVEEEVTEEELEAKQRRTREREKMEQEDGKAKSVGEVSGGGGKGFYG